MPLLCLLVPLQFNVAGDVADDHVLRYATYGMPSLSVFIISLALLEPSLPDIYDVFGKNP